MATPGRRRGQSAAGDGQGQGDVISGITHDPALDGQPKGPTVSDAASDGTSHAGEDHGRTAAQQQRPGEQQRRLGHRLGQQRHGKSGADDPAAHDANDDHGADDPASHDANDDHGQVGGSTTVDHRLDALRPSTTTAGRLRQRGKGKSGH